MPIIDIRKTIKNTDKILLIRPDYPDGVNNTKHGTSKLHHKYFPIGLLKMSTYFKNRGHQVDLIVGKGVPKLTADVIFITSLFTYWRSFLEETIQYYKFICPNAKIIVGGVDASLNPTEIEEMGVDVFIGVMEEVESVIPDYSYFKDDEIDFQVLHTSRGCIRRCTFCGTYIVEPNFSYKTAEEIEKEIFKNKITFYDNNLLANPHIKDILEMISNLKVNGKVINTVESKSGFDARLLIKDYDEVTKNGRGIEGTIFYLIKKARIIAPRIAWDNWLEEKPIIEKAVKLFEKVGYKRKDIQVFMLYNYELTYEQLEFKRRVCQKLGVQISDCRYRPLNSKFDFYDGKKAQTSFDYYIHKKWNDKDIKTFRKNVRGQNILIRYLANGKPILKDYMMKNNVPEKVLDEYCELYPWQENINSPIVEPVKKSIA